MLSSCFGLLSRELIKKRAIKKITVENGSIPANFGKEDVTIMCVLRGAKMFDKYMKKHVSNEYHGKYEFIAKGEVDSEKFKDKSTYRYIFNYRETPYEITTVDPVSNVPKQVTFMASTYFIYDRITYKRYEAPFTSRYSLKIIQGYMINLEKERLKNL